MISKLFKKKSKINLKNIEQYFYTNFYFDYNDKITRDIIKEELEKLGLEDIVLEYKMNTFLEIVSKQYYLRIYPNKLPLVKVF